MTQLYLMFIVNTSIRYASLCSTGSTSLDWLPVGYPTGALFSACGDSCAKYYKSNRYPQKAMRLSEPFNMYRRPFHCPCLKFPSRPARVQGSLKKKELHINLIHLHWL